MHDSGNEEKVTTTTVEIPVIRNVNSPTFDKSSYEAEINENAKVGTSLLSVTATDDDKVNMVYPSTIFIPLSFLRNEILNCFKRVLLRKYCSMV